jgi:hypothetical protein
VGDEENIMSDVNEVPPPPSPQNEEDRLRARVAELMEIFSVVAVENQDGVRLKLEAAKAVCGAFREMVDAFERRLDEALRITGAGAGLAQEPHGG